MAKSINAKKNQKETRLEMLQHNCVVTVISKCISFSIGFFSVAKVNELTAGFEIINGVANTEQSLKMPVP